MKRKARLHAIKSLLSIALSAAICLPFVPVAAQAAEEAQTYAIGDGRYIVITQRPQVEGYILRNYVPSEKLFYIYTMDQKQFGFCDLDGNIVVPATHDASKLQHVTSSVPTAPLLIYQDTVYVGNQGYVVQGLLDLYGNVVYPAQESSLFMSSDGLARVYRDGKYGYIDENGKLAIPYQYKFESFGTIDNFSDGMAYFFGLDYEDGSRSENNRGWIDKSGKVALTFDDVYKANGFQSNTGAFSTGGMFGDGLCIGNFYDEARGGYYNAAFDKTGEIVFALDDGMELDYWNSVFRCGRLPVYQHSADGNGDIMFGAIDTTGKLVIPFQYSNRGVYAPLTFRDGVGVVQQANPVIGIHTSIIDLNGNTIVPPKKWGTEDPSGASAFIEMEFTNGVMFIGSCVFRIVDELPAGGGKPIAPTEKPSSWAEGAVNAAIAANLVPHALQTQYTQAATRAEFCALATALYETVTGTEIAGRTTFLDTTDINVEKMASLGVVTGVGGGNFSPDSKLTREQAATMLARLSAAVGKPLSPQAPSFTDNGSISPWALDAVGQVQAANVMGGVGGNSFAPQDDYTREQSILTMKRLFDLVK